MIHCGENVYKILASKRNNLIQPLENDCSLYGKKKSRSVWCAHLVSAGYKMGVKVHPRYDGTKNLTQLQKYQEGNRKRTGRKRPKENDYKDLTEEYITPNRGPWKCRKVVKGPGEPVRLEPASVKPALLEPASVEPALL